MTLEDEALMREVLAALIEDTGRQISLMDAAIRERDTERCKRLAHYCKGACANVGANAAAWVLRRMEEQVRAGDFEDCVRSLAALGQQLGRLREEAARL